MVRFGQPLLIADGIGLRIWHSGSQAGQPKLPKAVASMLEPRLVQIGPGSQPFWLVSPLLWPNAMLQSAPDDRP